MEGGSSDPRVPLGQWPSRASTEGLCREKEARKGRCWCAVLPRNVLPRNVPPRPRLLVLCSQPRSPQPCRWVAGTQTGRTRSPRDPDCHCRSRAWPAHGAVRSRGVRVCAELTVLEARSAQRLILQCRCLPSPESSPCAGPKRNYSGPSRSVSQQRSPFRSTLPNLERPCHPPTKMNNQQSDRGAGGVGKGLRGRRAGRTGCVPATSCRPLFRLRD